MNQGAKILVVDDETAICRFLNAGLSAQGYAVFEAHSGKEALLEFSNQRPDVVILDLNLPDMKGGEVLRKIRERSSAPVIVLSVKEAETDKVALLESGADDYLTKPFSLAELSVRVKVALRHYFGQMKQPVFLSAPLEIDFSSRIVKIKNKEVKLTATEYDLLKLLAQNAGKVVTQRHLLREIWGPHATSHAHYLRIYVAQLRKKLELDEDCKGLIVTEPNVGYRLKLNLGGGK